MDNMIRVSTDEKTVKALGDYILKILGAKVDQVTIQKALEVLGDGASINGLTITNCTLTNNEKEEE